MVLVPVLVYFQCEHFNIVLYFPFGPYTDPRPIPVKCEYTMRNNIYTSFRPHIKLLPQAIEFLQHDFFTNSYLDFNLFTCEREWVLHFTNCVGAAVDMASPANGHVGHPNLQMIHWNTRNLHVFTNKVFLPCLLVTTIFTLSQRKGLETMFDIYLNHASRLHEYLKFGT